MQSFVIVVMWLHFFVVNCSAWVNLKWWCRSHKSKLW